MHAHQQSLMETRRVRCSVTFERPGNLYTVSSISPSRGRNTESIEWGVCILDAGTAAPACALEANDPGPA